ncbi:hypothetical protein DYB26_000545 [Aphanomyces astaci]|uniref:Uncharacterized protein n=1 Tax=Aphanomyces astaci TaxID=112090 RepID=A0A3R6XFD7_APHAT|nr:hypothetical protein DYB26_000545 [Aphanomyces astaci]
MADGGGGNNPARPSPTFPTKLQQLDPLESKKVRDKRRKREQAARRKAAEKELLHATLRRQLAADASKAWHRDTNNDEELQIKRFELDCVSPFDEHPASAGYDFRPQLFRSLTPASVACFNPVFFGYALTKTSSTALPPRPQGMIKQDIPHPAFLGYIPCHHHDATAISPVFLGMEFRKRHVRSDNDMELCEGVGTPGVNGSTPRTRQLAAAADLKRIMDARFDTTECLVCDSSQLEGCPGCWEPLSDFYAQPNQTADQLEMSPELAAFSCGFFWMDELVLAASERTLAITRGNLTLMDFKLTPRSGRVCMFVLFWWLVSKWVCCSSFHALDVMGRRHANEVPEPVVDDPLQQSMHRKAPVLVESALLNFRMSREYDLIATRKAIKASRDEKMLALVERSRHLTNQPRPRKVVRAYAYFRFALAEPKPLPRLAKLWQCFQKFDELKITKRGKLLDAAYSDDTASLLSQHRSAAVDTFDILVDKANHAMMHPVVAVSNKYGIPLGTRYGVTAKEDREYAVELDIVLPEEIHVKLDVASPEDGGGGSHTSRRRRFHDVLAAQAAAAVWKDMEWRKEARSEKFYGGADLVVAPYYLVRWDCFAQAYSIARSHLERAKDHLDAYNRLAKPVQTEAVLKPREIERWTADVDALMRELPATGALTQACRRLQSKAGLLPARASRYLKALKKSREDAAKALEQDEALPPITSTEKLKLDFKLREGVLSNNFRQLAPDMDVVKERMASVMRKGVGKTKYLAQQVKDNIDILKL